MIHGFNDETKEKVEMYSAESVDNLLSDINYEIDWNQSQINPNAWNLIGAKTYTLTKGIYFITGWLRFNSDNTGNRRMMIAEYTGSTPSNSIAYGFSDATAPADGIVTECKCCGVYRVTEDSKTIGLYGYTSGSGDSENVTGRLDYFRLDK